MIWNDRGRLLAGPLVRSVGRRAASRARSLRRQLTFDLGAERGGRGLPDRADDPAIAGGAVAGVAGRGGGGRGRPAGAGSRSSRLGVRARSAAVDEAAVLDAVGRDRSVVRTWLMRGTVHLVAAADVRWMTELFGPMLERGYRSRWRQLGITEALVQAAVPHVRELLDGRALTRHELAAEKATVVSDGRVIGRWRLDRAGRSAAVRVTPFEPFSRGHRDELDRERADIERFVGRPVALALERELLASGACARSSTQKRATPVPCGRLAGRSPTSPTSP
jgi:hypothetical protein